MTLVKDIIKAKKEYKNQRTVNLKNPEKYLKTINTLKSYGNTGVSMLAKMRTFADAEHRRVSLISAIYRKDLKAGKVLDAAKKYSKATTIKRQEVKEESVSISA